MNFQSSIARQQNGAKSGFFNANCRSHFPGNGKWILPPIGMTNNKRRKLLQSEVRFDLSRSLQSSRPEKVFLKYFSSSHIEKTKNKEDKDMRIFWNIFETFLATFYSNILSIIKNFNIILPNTWSIGYQCGLAMRLKRQQRKSIKRQKYAKEVNLDWP